MVVIEVVQGFSPLNRALLYSSALLAPATALKGRDSSGYSNIGFIAYNVYTQVVWYQAATAKQLSVVSLITPHTNLTLAVVYLGGIFSNNIFTSLLLQLCAAALVCLNTTTAWISYKTNQPMGYGEWEFFFFGWRKLTKGWHNFLLVWQIGDTIMVLGFAIFVIIKVAWVGAQIFYTGKRETHWASTPPANSAEQNLSNGGSIIKRGQQFLLWRKDYWWYILATIPYGGFFALLVVWPLILWIELIMRRNHVKSETDWVAVYVFIAQCGLLLLPKFTPIYNYFKDQKKVSNKAQLEQNISII